MRYETQDDVTVTPKRAAALFGAAFAFVFLMVFDADAMPRDMLTASKWLVLLPAAFVFSLRPHLRHVVRTAASLAGGVFVGVCAVALLHSSNIWPIAGVYWTYVWAPPIVIGSAAGVLAARLTTGRG